MVGLDNRVDSISVLTITRKEPQVMGETPCVFYRGSFAIREGFEYCDR